MFSSFWMGGYEGADHVNAQGQALDMARASGHLDRLDEDYRRAARLGLRTLRESIGWRLSEAPGGALDLRRVHRIAQAARRAGVQPLWTLMHYGLPADLSLFDDALIERFARFAAAVARTLRPLMPGPRVYTPINEISFLAWAATSGGLLRDPGAPEALGGLDAASTEHSGYEVKRRLARAALAGMAAIRAEDPEARFLHVEPLVHVAPPPDRPDLAPLAQQIRDYQWQTLDLLGGRLEPALGGHAQALDWLGFNHYHSSQWEAHSEARLAWHLRDPRRLPLHVLLHEAWRRYGRPLALAETGHVGMGRAAWLHEVAGEARQARERGVPLGGVCLYPLLDRPDWQDATRWHRCGLWHVGDAAGSGAPRHLVQACAGALRDWQRPDRAREHRLLVLLPTRWERLPAGLQRLLRRLTEAAFEVLLAEPPGPSTGPVEVRHHALGPALNLRVVHGLGPGGWARHAGPALAALREALGPGPAGGSAVWLMQTPAGDAIARLARLARELFPGAALIRQPEPLAPGAHPDLEPSDLLLCDGPALRRDVAARHPRSLALPRGLPADLLRPPAAGSYEAQEAERLLGPRTGPRLLLPAPSDAMPDPAWLHALAAALPGCRLYGIGPPASSAEHSHLAALGELAPELLPGLLWACDAALVPERGGSELIALARASGLPVVRLPAASAQDLTPAAEAIARKLGRGPSPPRRPLGAWCRRRAAHTRAYEAAEARLVTALLDVLAQAATAARPGPAALPPRPWPAEP